MSEQHIAGRLADIARRAQEIADVATGAAHFCDHGRGHRMHACYCPIGTDHDWQATNPACGHVMVSS